MITMTPEVLYDYARIAILMDPDPTIGDRPPCGAYSRNPDTAWFELHIHDYSAHEMAVQLNLSVNYVRRKAKRLGLEFTNCNY